MTTDQSLSIIHINSRSLYANFENIQQFLNQFQTPFRIIAISETWISDGKDADFDLNGYEMYIQNRKSKNGGGVALYVDKNLRSKLIPNMTTTLEGVMEGLTIEIIMENRRNILVSCLYRAPGSDIENFKNCVEKMFTKSVQKDIFICGDFNIDLMKSKQHKPIEDFLDMMYSLTLFPKITRPTRITTHCATLIDNIFTNNIELNMVSGILVNDISDHLPVFVYFQVNNGINESKYQRKPGKVIYKRLRTEDTITALRTDLMSQDWNIV